MRLAVLLTIIEGVLKVVGAPSDKIMPEITGTLIGTLLSFYFYRVTETYKTNQAGK